MMKATTKRKPARAARAKTPSKKTKNARRAPAKR
jgi:hypothetical protein